MKNGRAVLGLVLLTAFIGSTCVATAQSGSPRVRPSILQFFTNNPSATYVITNLLAEPAPELSLPLLSRTNTGPAATYWTLKNGPAPMPLDPFPDLPVYQVGTNQYLIDDRSVDYSAVATQQAEEDEALGLTNAVITAASIDTNGLWLQAATNCLATNGCFTANLMNTLQGQSYDILTKSDLLTPTWVTELTVTGAVGSVTSLSLPMCGRTNLFVWARTSVAKSFYLITQPLSQAAFDNDTITFAVQTGGNASLTYQWTLNGIPITGATNDTYTINLVYDSGFSDYYTCIISDGTNSLATAPAQLLQYFGQPIDDDPLYIVVVGARQNYVFRNGYTYYIGEPNQLYGHTVIEGGAVLKFDFDSSTNSSLAIMGDLDCQTDPFNPAILTSFDDDSIGEISPYSTGSPQAIISGVPYLDLTAATSANINNLRIRFADWGMTTPVNSQRLEVWNSQFVGCDYGVVNLVAGTSTNCFHNVLFAINEACVAASTNTISIEGEQVTADVNSFCLASTTPRSISLTNSVVWGSPLSATSVSAATVAMSPNTTNFVSTGEGYYYLAPGSSLHAQGTTNISTRLQQELHHKTTAPPIAITAYAQIRGKITLSQQAPRYASGAPDLGYYYTPLDYTIASLNLSGGSLTVLPGTVVGVRNEYSTAGPAGGSWTTYGIYVNQGGSVTSHGTPNQPNIFTWADAVQEFPNISFAEFQADSFWNNLIWLPGIVSFATDFESGDPTPPSLDFRFSNFYLPRNDYHIGAGLTDDGYIPFSSDSCVNLTLRDCQVVSGQIDLGQPGSTNYPSDFVFGSCSVTWQNTLFDQTSINLDPTFYENGSDDQGPNVDMAFQATGNLFRGGQWFHLEPVPASAGNWLLENNLFDRVALMQDANQPLDFNYNAYWPLSSGELYYNFFFSDWWINANSQLQSTYNSDGLNGGNEPVLSVAPPYQHGPFGNYYLSQITPLYQAGSHSAWDAGLSQYTTFTNEIKDSSNAPVNIGLHYVSASITDALPLDSDGDGVPDYVEAENGTDPFNPMTDGINLDCSNSAYLDIDLSGNGLVGRIKNALGEDPLNPANPLILTQVFTGEEPDFATFEVPVSYAAVVSSGALNVNMNGIDVTLEECTPATNGNCLLSFNVGFDPAGLHYLSAGFRLGTEPEAGSPIMTAGGVLQPFISSNSAQLFESNAMFDNTSAYLDARASYINSDYIINLYNPDTTPPTWLAAITNSTTDGSIQEEWNLTCADGSIYAGNNISAEYDITPSAGSSVSSASFYSPKRILTRATNSLSEWGPNMDVSYFYTPTNSSLGIEFANAGTIWNGMQSVVDVLTMPIWGYPVYNSYFDQYTCYYCGNNARPYPGYIQSRYDITNSLLPDMANGATKQIYIYGHGTNGYMGNWVGDAYISSYDVSQKLNNSYTKKSGLQAHNPYRFVFLDGCSTASGKDWRRAFGIYPLDVTNTLIRSKVGPQAYVGWADVHTGWLNLPDDSSPSQAVATGYAQTLANFYAEWMNGGAVVDCIYDATKSTYGTVPIPTPENRDMTIFVNGYHIHYTNVMTSKIYLVGYPGLKVDRTDSSRNADTTYAAPKNVE